MNVPLQADGRIVRRHSSAARSQMRMIVRAKKHVTHGILLANSAADMLWALLMLFAPQIVYMIIDGKALAKEIKKDVREQKEKEAKQERERLEQERREELGRWK